MSTTAEVEEKKPLKSSKHLLKTHNLDNLIFQETRYLLKYQFWKKHSILKFTFSHNVIM